MLENGAEIEYYRAIEDRLRNQFKFGYATALSMVLLVFLLVLGWLQLRILRRELAPT